MAYDDLCSFGELLRTFRTRTRLTQQQLARAIGLHRNAISHWEQGDFLPRSRGMVLELARHLKLGDQETRQLLETSLTAVSSYWSVPLSRNPYFTGREGILEALHTQLGVDQAVALTQSSALHGLGGMGKTQIALEYAYRHALEYSAVFWIAAEAEESLISSLLHIGEVLQVPGDHDQQRVIAVVQNWLTTHGRWLLIWDNVEDLDLLQRFLPATRSGAFLLTTRRQALGTLARGLDLAPMALEEGILFLLRRAKVLGPDVSGEQIQQCVEHTPAQYAIAAELVTELGGLPLALDQAGAYLEETQCGLPAYLERFCTYRAVLLRQRGSGTSGHPASVSTTFTLAITAIAESHPAALDLLHVCALLSPDAIPEGIFRQGGAYLGPRLQAVCGDALEWDRVVSVAWGYSLLSRQSEEQTLSLHRLVQAVFLDTMTEAEREQWNTRVIAALDTVFPENLTHTGYTAWKQGESLLVHTLSCLHRAGEASGSLVFASLAYKVAQYLREKGRYGEAEALLQRALHIQVQARGPQHLDVASCLDELAILSFRQGKFEQAARLFQQALHIWEQALGPEHLMVARPLYGLARLHLRQGEYKQAESFYQRALHIWEQALGPEHPEVAKPLNGLAILYSKQGKYKQAEPLYRRALQIWEQALGPMHPLVAHALVGLAELADEQGKDEQIEPLCQRALQIREQALGPMHPEVAYPLAILANLLSRQGKYKQAELFYRRTLQIWEQTLGPHHPEVAVSLNSLANLSLEENQYSEAESFLQRALSIREQHFGSDHPETAETLHGLALLRQKQGHWSEALSLADRASQIRSQMLGNAHPYTMASQALSAQLLQKQAGVQKEAAPPQEQAVGAEPTAEQVRTLLKARGWSLHLKKRRGKPYVYATRKAGQHTHSRYLAPLSNLAACLAAASTLPNAKEK